MEYPAAMKECKKTDRVTTRSEITYITRRHSLRIPFNTRIKYGLIRNNIYKEHSEPRLGGFVINLSHGGMAIEGLKALPPEALIRGNLFTGDNTYKFEGKVKWSDMKANDKCKMGIEFTGRADKINELYTKTVFKNRFGI